MDRSTTIAVALAFIAGGVVTYVVIDRSTRTRAELCVDQCKAAGKQAIYAPAGTAGRHVEGGTPAPGDDHACFCLETPSTQPSGKR